MRIRKVWDFLVNFFETFSFVLFTIAVLITFTEVLCRNLPIGLDLPWSDEAARYLVIGAVFLASGKTIRLGVHISVDLVVELLKGPAKKIIKTFNVILIAIFLCLLIYGGIKMVANNADLNAVALPISMAVPYVFIPLGAFIMLIEILLKEISSVLPKLKE